jgi:hypothetical protein
MSRLATALHAQPPGTWINATGAALQRYATLLDQHEQCRRAFMQAPSPRLGAALEQIEREISRERRLLKMDKVKP